MIGGRRHRCFFFFVNRKLRLMPMAIAILVVLTGRRNIYSNLLSDIIKTQRRGDDNVNSYLSPTSITSHDVESNNDGGGLNPSIDGSNNSKSGCWKRIGPKRKLHRVANCHPYRDAAAGNVTIHDLEPELALIPIYLVNLSSSSSSTGLLDVGSVMDISYADLASNWDRNTSYEDILLKSRHRSTTIVNSGEDLIRRKNSLLRHGGGSSSNGRHENDDNVTLIFHTSPKMASSTLRKACIDVQCSTCPNDIISTHICNENTSWKMPDGYRSPKRLLHLLTNCPNTRHFCQMEGTPLTIGYVAKKDDNRVYDERNFLHVFPFRQYDAWSVSALHQVSYRDGESGCNETRILLDDCKPHQYELDFDVYTKSNMAKFLRSLLHVAGTTAMASSSKHDVAVVVGNDDEENDYHHVSKEDVMSRHQILLYDYSHLHETIRFLSSNDYGVSDLPGTEMKINTAYTTLESGKVRVQLTPCLEETSILNRFHNCFSDELGPLY